MTGTDCGGSIGGYGVGRGEATGAGDVAEVGNLFIVRSYKLKVRNQRRNETNHGRLRRLVTTVIIRPFYWFLVVRVRTVLVLDVKIGWTCCGPKHSILF